MCSYNVSLQKIISMLIEDFPDVGRQYYGVATQVTDIQNFYIVPNSVYNIMSVLEHPGIPKKSIEGGNHVIYFSPLLDHFARGVVKWGNTDGTYAVFAIDYGVFDLKVESSSIFKLLHEAEGSIPGLAQYCELMMCFPRGGGQFTEEAKDDKEKLLVTVREISNGKMGVDIMSSPDTISTVLAYTNHSSWSLAPFRSNKKSSFSAGNSPAAVK